MRNNPLRRVSREFDDMLKEMQDEASEVFGIKLEKTEITKAIAKKKPSIVDLFSAPRGKKGFIGSLIVFSIIMVVTILAIFIIKGAWDDISPTLPDVANDPNDALINQSITYTNETFNGLDLMLPFAAALLTIGLLASVFALDTSRMFFIVMLIAGILFMAIVPMLSNMVTETMDSADLSATKADFPAIYFLMSHWPLYILINIGLGILTLYARSRFE